MAGAGHERAVLHLGPGARGTLQVRGGLGEPQPCGKLSLRAAAPGKKGAQRHSPTVLFLHHVHAPPQAQRHKPLLQGHWPLQIRTRTSESSLNLFFLCSSGSFMFMFSPPGWPFPLGGELDLPFGVATCQAPGFGLNPMASDRGLGSASVGRGESPWLAEAGRERARISGASSIIQMPVY